MMIPHHGRPRAVGMVLREIMALGLGWPPGFWVATAMGNDSKRSEGRKRLLMMTRGWCWRRSQPGAGTPFRAWQGAKTSGAGAGLSD